MHPLLLPLGIGLAGGQIATVFLFGIHASFLDIAVIFLLVGTMLMQHTRFIPAHWAPILGFAGASLLSIVYHASEIPVFWSAIAGLYVMRFLMYASLYWVTASPVFRKEHVFTMLAGSGLLIAILGLIQFFLYPDLRNLYYLGWDPHLNRLFSTILDPNFAGIILAFTAFLFIGFLSSKKKLHALAGLLIVLMALVLTYSRSSYIAFGAGLLVWGLLSGRKAIAGFLLTTSVFLMLIVPHAGEGQNLLRVTSSLARVETISRAVSLFTKHPFIGAGMNTLLHNNLTAGVSTGQTIPSLTGSGVDTSLLYAAATSGILGLFLITWLLLICVHIGRMGLRASGPVKEASALFLAGLTSLIIHSLFVNSLFYPWVLVWLFMTLGVMERWVRADR